jgi:DNA polymerase I
MTVPTLYHPVVHQDDRVFSCVSSTAGLVDLAQRLADAPVLSVDWETTSADVWSEDFDYLGLAIAASVTEGYYIPVGHMLPPERGFFDMAPPNVTLEAVWQHLGPLLQTRRLVVHNAKFDIYGVFERLGWEMSPDLFDTYIAGGLTNSSRELKLNLKHLTRAWLGRDAKEISDVTGSKSYNMRHAPIELVTEYAAADACNTYGIYQLTNQKLDKWPRIKELFYKLEMPIIRTVAQMEQTGIRVDTEILREIHVRTIEDITRSHEVMQEIAGYPFDPKRSDHRRHMLYDVLCLPAARRQGKETTERKQLQLLFQLMAPEEQERARPFFEAFVTWSVAEKIRSTYTYNIIEKLDHQGRIHPSFFQIDTATGRMSSGKPINFQNIPRDKKTYDVRAAFVPDPGWKFILADYVQMEFKIGAALCGDSTLVAIANDTAADVHLTTARACFNIAEDAPVPDEKRQAAKTMTYALQYGASPYGVAKLLLIQEREARRLIDAFYGAYPGLAEWAERCRVQIKERGYSETYYGRRRWGDMKVLHSHNEEARDSEFRRLGNMIVQGTGADITKLAMKRVTRWLQAEGFQSQIVGQIHDELVILSPDDEAATVMERVEDLMTAQVENVTLPVEASIRSSLSKSPDAILAGKG